MYKICCSCKREFGIASFLKSSREKTGYTNVCKECNRNYKQKWRTTKKEHLKKYRALYLYNLSEEQFKNLEQKCYGCGTQTNLVIDHCHSTEEVRGVLCSPCNLALGHIKDNTKTLENLISYLKNPPIRTKDKE